jgi:hypothetical protein
VLKREIKYTYTNDKNEEVTETGTYYFNLSKREVLKLEVDTDGGLSGMIREISADNADNQKIFNFFEKFVLMSFGIRKDEGRRFEKTDEILHEFKTSLAYDALFDQLTFSEDSAGYLAEFIKGTMPPDFISAEAIEKAVAEMKEAQAKAEQEASAATST